MLKLENDTVTILAGQDKFRYGIIGGDGDSDRLVLKSTKEADIAYTMSGLRLLTLMI